MPLPQYPNCTHCKCFHQGEACCWCADGIDCYQDEDLAQGSPDGETPQAEKEDKP